jgi:two-component system LytT family response regulator
MSEFIPHKTIIVDDEALARRAITLLLKKHPHFEVVAQCANGFEAIKAVQEYQPQLMFLDIQMPRLDGFDVVELLEEPKPYIIFVSAFDQYAVQAFEINALDYLLKPVAEERFSLALERYMKKFSAGQENLNMVLHQKKKNSGYLNRVVLKDGTDILILGVKDILYFEAADDYVKIHIEKEYYLKNDRLQHFEESLDPQLFVRIHRSYIINITFLKSLETYSKESKLAVLKNDLQLPISRNGYKKLKEALSL